VQCMHHFINNSSVIIYHVILQRITQEQYAYFLRGYNDKIDIYKLIN